MSQPLSSKEVRRAMKKLCTDERTTKEGNYILEVDDIIVGRVTVPKGDKPGKAGTFHSQCSQAKLQPDEMRACSACTFGRADYEAVIRVRVFNQASAVTKYRCAWCNDTLHASRVPDGWVEVIVNESEPMSFHVDTCLEAWRSNNPNAIVRALSR